MVLRFLDNALGVLTRGVAKFKTDPVAQGIKRRFDAASYNLATSPPNPLTIVPRVVVEGFVKGNPVDIPSDRRRPVNVFDVPTPTLEGAGGSTLDLAARTVGAAGVGVTTGLARAAAKSIDADDAARSFGQGVKDFLDPQKRAEKKFREREREFSSAPAPVVTPSPPRAVVVPFVRRPSSSPEEARGRRAVHRAEKRAKNAAIRSAREDKDRRNAAGDIARYRARYGRDPGPGMLRRRAEAFGLIPPLASGAAPVAPVVAPVVEDKPFGIQPVRPREARPSGKAPPPSRLVRGAPQPPRDERRFSIQPVMPAVPEGKGSMFDKAKQWWGDLREEAIAKGANTIPMTGAAIPTLSTPADEFVGRVEAGEPGGVGRQVATGLGALALGALAAEGVRRGVKAVRARRAKKAASTSKASPKKTAAKKAAKKAAKAKAGHRGKAARKAARASATAAKKSGRKREDASGVMKGTYRGQPVYVTKNGRPYVIRTSGPMKGMAKFIPR